MHGVHTYTHICFQSIKPLYHSHVCNRKAYLGSVTQSNAHLLLRVTLGVVLFLCRHRKSQRSGCIASGVNVLTELAYQRPQLFRDEEFFCSWYTRMLNRCTENHKTRTLPVHNATEFILKHLTQYCYETDNEWGERPQACLSSETRSLSLSLSLSIYDMRMRINGMWCE